MTTPLRSNVGSLFTQNQLATAHNSTAQTFERLGMAKGARKNSDETSGFGTQESMNAQVRSYAVAERNANDRITALQSATSTAHQLSSLLTAMRDLTQKVADGALAEGDGPGVQREFQAIKTEIQRLLQQQQGQEAPKHDKSSAVTPSAMTREEGMFASFAAALSESDLQLNVDAEGSNGTDGPNPTGAALTLAAIDGSLSLLHTTREGFDDALHRLTATVLNIQSARTTLSASFGRIQDFAGADEASKLARRQIGNQASAALAAQANQTPHTTLSLLRD
jgi:flagellin